MRCAGALVACALVGQGWASPDRLSPLEQDLRAGRYEAVVKAADRVARRPGPLAARASVLAARAERHLGRLDQARRRLELATIAAARDLPLRAELLRLLDAVGDRGALKDLVDRSYEDWESGAVDKTSAANLVAMSVALRYDNNWQDANDLLRKAVKARPGWAEANVEWGETFLEKHAADQAEESFREALKSDGVNPDARVGLARALLEQSYDGPAAEKELAAALAVNPRHAGALATRGELALDAEDWEAVAAVAASLRRTNARDESAAWLTASAALLLDDRAGYERERKARFAAHPGDAKFLGRVAEALVRHRRYDDARAIAAEAVALDGEHGRALATLGTTLLRLGEEREGLEALRRAFDRDPYDVRTYNLLNLFEKVIAKRYTIVETTHLRFRVEPSARAAIEQVVGPFLEDTYERYVERYGFAPTGPVTFELYGDPSHFAVRTVGLPRLGVSAVCFGRVITSQAPTNAAFNWGMVLSHELAHVFALQLSRNRVPRWFTEGLAELESARLRTEWRRRGELALAAALKAGAVPPIDRLSQAFVRARTMEAASTAYLVSAVALEFLEARFGFGAIREALAAFGRGERLAAVLETTTGMKLAALDGAFREHLRARVGALGDQFLPFQLAKLGPPPEPPGKPGEARGPAALANEGLWLLYTGSAQGATEALARARGLPGGKEDPVAGFLAAELAVATGDMRGAHGLLSGLLEAGRDGYDVRVRLGLSALRLDDRATAEAHLRAAIALAPTEMEPRVLLAESLGAAGKGREKLAEEQAILRLEPQNASLAKRVVLEAARAGKAGLVAELAPMALFIDPADADMHAALARALASRGDVPAALAAFGRALAMTPSDAAAIHRSLADLYERLGERARAAEHRRKASTPAAP